MKKNLSLTLIAVVTTLVLFSCTKTPVDDPNYKILRYPLSDDAKTLDPAVAYDTISATVLYQSIETLYQYKYFQTPLELEPLLADGMPEISKDKLVYKIKIKQGVRFQDDPAFAEGKGRELKAQDFIYNWQRMLIPALLSGGTWVFVDKVVGFQIKLLKPFPQLLYVLAMNFGAPMAKEVTQKYGHEGLSQNMVGTGPYKLKSYVRGSKIILVKNPNFRGEKYPSDGDPVAKENSLLAYAGRDLPFVHEIQFHVIKEEQPAWLRFQTGELDIGYIPKDNFATAIQASNLSPELVKKGIQLQKSSDPYIYYLVFNLKDPVVGKNKALRKAIARAIDRDYWINLFLNGRAIKATSAVHLGKLMAEAGYPEGKGLPELKLDLRGSSPTQRQQGEYMAKALAELGIKLKVEANTFPAFLEKQKKGNLQIFFGGWSADYPDAENFMQLLYSKNASPGPNYSSFNNKEYDALYLKLSAMAPSEERTDLIRRAEEIAFNDGVWSMLYYPLRYSLSQGWVKNYRPNSIIFNDLKYLDLDYDKKKALHQ
jgi:oligopeptide transport system substrate-binding protein